MAPLLPSLFIAFIYLHLAAANGAISLEVSNNPAYDKQPVTFTCGFSAIPSVLRVSFRAFNGSTVTGEINCYVTTGLTKDGIFAEVEITGCASSLQYLIVPLTASTSLALDYMCSIVYNYPQTQVLNSTVVRLWINVAPSVPQLYPATLVFNDSDSFTVRCVSMNGSPEANLSLAIRQESSSSYATAQNITSVAVTRTASKDWHNAVVTCRVQNHNLSNMTTTAILQVNYILVPTSPLPVSTASGDVTLDCSNFVESFPPSTFLWSAPPVHNVSVLDATGSRLSQVTVPQGQSGLFNCTASNAVSGRSVIVVFTVTGDVIVSPLPSSASPSDSTGLIIGVIVAIVIVMVLTILMFILYRRGHFAKRKPANGRGTGEPKSQDAGSITLGNTVMRDNDLYEAYGRKSSDDDATGNEYSNRVLLPEEEAGGDLGRANHQPGSATSSTNASVKKRRGWNSLPTDVTPSPDLSFKKKLKTQSFVAAFDRLLLAATGLSTNLKHKVLRSTCLVEYSEQSSSLTVILDAIRGAAERPKFKHVALLLRPTDEGPLLSRPDGQVINSSTVSSNKPLRNFLLTLSKLCLDRSCRDARVDLLNDAGAAGSHLRGELVRALDDLLEVQTSVSGDMYGISTKLDRNGGTVADLYFDRHHIEDVVYADIELPNDARQAAPRDDRVDRVVYSEVLPPGRPLPSLP